jgi:hypothetical protein
MRRVPSCVEYRARVPVSRLGLLRCVSVGSELEFELASQSQSQSKSAFQSACASRAFRESSALRQSRALPRTALAPALLGLRRAAEARKSRRIARRFAALGGVDRTEAFGQHEGAREALFE